MAASRRGGRAGKRVAEPAWNRGAEARGAKPSCRAAAEGAEAALRRGGNESEPRSVRARGGRRDWSRPSGHRGPADRPVRSAGARPGSCASRRPVEVDHVQAVVEGPRVAAEGRRRRKSDARGGSGSGGGPNRPGGAGTAGRLRTAGRLGTATGGTGPIRSASAAGGRQAVAAGAEEGRGGDCPRHPVQPEA